MYTEFVIIMILFDVTDYRLLYGIVRYRSVRVRRKYYIYFFLLNGYKFIYNEEEIPSEGETSGNNCLQPHDHFHAVKF